MSIVSGLFKKLKVAVDKDKALIIAKDCEKILGLILTDLEDGKIDLGDVIALVTAVVWLAETTGAKQSWLVIRFSQPVFRPAFSLRWSTVPLIASRPQAISRGTQ